MENKMQIEIKKEYYEKNANGKNWQTKPYNTTTEMGNGKNYEYIIQSLSFFKNFSSYQRIEKMYTIYGYIPYRITEISPDGKTKLVITINFL